MCCTSRTSAGATAVEVVGEVSSKTHPAQWKLLTRVVEGPRAKKFPEIARLFGTGSNDKKKDVLKKFLTSGENLDSCEGSFVVARRHKERLTRGHEELTVKEMVDRGFSEPLVVRKSKRRRSGLFNRLC